jgi:hypothetical protein
MSGSSVASDLMALYGADPSPLMYDSTMPRRVLHKATVEAVFMTDSLAIRPIWHPPTATRAMGAATQRHNNES